MKQFLFYALFTIFVIVGVSCSHEDVLLPVELENRSLVQVETVKPDTNTFVTASKAKEIANQYNMVENNVRSKTVCIDNMESICDDYGNVLMYIVNFVDNNGFIIVSANTHVTPILAYSETGKFDLDNIVEGHPIISWLNEKKYVLMHSESLSASQKEMASLEWMKYYGKKVSNHKLINELPKPQVYYDSLQRWAEDPNVELYLYEDYVETPEYSQLSSEEKKAIKDAIYVCGNGNYGTIESSTVVLRKSISQNFVNQLMSTTWSQVNGYNKYIPNYGYVGCQPVAVGQIMKFYQYPSSFSWKEMENSRATDVTAMFLYTIGKDMGIDYDNGDSGAPTQKAVDVLKKYGYTATLKNYNSNDVARDVRAGKPVFMRGVTEGASGGHTWVCSGIQSYGIRVLLQVMTLDYRPTTFSTPDLMVKAYEKELMYHQETPKFYYNWGYGGSQDGYFYDDDIKVSTSDGWEDFGTNRKSIFVSPGK